MKPGFNEHCDVCVIGGGLMGSAVALGLKRLGADVLILDKNSSIHRASKANFGLVWSQSKGPKNHDYSRLSIDAVLGFQAFSDQLEDETGLDLELRLGCGLVLSIGKEELEARKKAIDAMHRMAAAKGETHPSRIIDRRDVEKIVGSARLGDDVTGGSLSDIDGDVNPLFLLRAMRQAFLNNQGRFAQGCTVTGITRQNGAYCLDTTLGRIFTPRIVLAAGLGNIDLAVMLGKAVPIREQKGQLLVTERVAPFLPFPMSGLRQTGNGSVMIGYTQEDTGFDVSTTAVAARQLSRRALRIFPGLSGTRVVRSWAGLRVLTGDGSPVYDEIDENAFLLATHSCVTLAPIHESLLPPWILGGPKPDRIQPFNLERFHV